MKEFLKEHWLHLLLYVFGGGLLLGQLVWGLRKEDGVKLYFWSGVSAFLAYFYIDICRKFWRGWQVKKKKLEGQKREAEDAARNLGHNSVVERW